MAFLLPVPAEYHSTAAKELGGGANIFVIEKAERGDSNEVYRFENSRKVPVTDASEMRHLLGQGKPVIIMAEPSTKIFDESSEIMRLLIQSMDPQGLAAHPFNNLPTEGRSTTYAGRVVLFDNNHVPYDVTAMGPGYDISGLAAVVKDINKNSGVRISSVRVLQESDKQRLAETGTMTNDDMMVGEFDGRYHLFVTPRIASAPEKLKGKDPGGSSSTFTQREGTPGANLAEGVRAVLDLVNPSPQKPDGRHITSSEVISLNSSFADWFPGSERLAREQTSVPTFGELADRQNPAAAAPVRQREPAKATPGVDGAAALPAATEGAGVREITGSPAEWPAVLNNVYGPEIMKEVKKRDREIVTILNRHDIDIKRLTFLNSGATTVVFDAGDLVVKFAMLEDPSWEPTMAVPSFVNQPLYRANIDGLLLSIEPKLDT
ncbi:MAG: hypothetical protein AAB356_05945, partial [Deltaproteobacteria bacterium]